jgi:hypothetical protein
MSTGPNYMNGALLCRSPLGQLVRVMLSSLPETLIPFFQSRRRRFCNPPSPRPQLLTLPAGATASPLPTPPPATRGLAAAVAVQETPACTVGNAEETGPMLEPYMAASSSRGRRHRTGGDFRRGSAAAASRSGRPATRTPPSRSARCWYVLTRSIPVDFGRVKCAAFPIDYVDFVRVIY